jgi:hypothetical protein
LSVLKATPQTVESLVPVGIFDCETFVLTNEDENGPIAHANKCYYAGKIAAADYGGGGSKQHTFDKVLNI